MPDLNHRERLRVQLRRQAETLEQAAEVDVAARQEREAALEERSRLEAAHPEFLEESQRRATTAMFAKLAIPTIWLLDVFLLGAAAHYIAHILGLRGAWLAVAKYVVPGLFVVLDLVFASARGAARDAAFYDEDRASRHALTGWTAACITLVAIYGVITGATQWMAHAQSMLAPVVTLPLTFGLAALALVVHAALIFGSADVKAYALYSWRHAAASRRERQAVVRSRSAATAAVTSYNRLALGVESYNQRFGQQPFRITYSLPTRELLRRHLGYDVIQPAPDTPATPPEDGTDTAGLGAAQPNDREVRL